MKRTKFFALNLALLILLTFGAARSHAAAKYVFLFIGDGMGAQQRNAAELFLAGKGGEREEASAHLVMNSLPAQGFAATSPYGGGITDSAAAGTAIATGQKTKNRVVSLHPVTAAPLKSIAELARDAGMKVGIVTTSYLNDATPAAFYGHASNRNELYPLGEQLVKSGFDYFAGGGISSRAGGKSAPKRDLYRVAADGGYVVTDTADAFRALRPGKKAIAVNPVLSGATMPYAADRRPERLPLAAYVSKGVELLDNPRGFFMMAEGGKIDLACHANDAAAAIGEVIDFDDAIRVAMDFLESRPDDTLIVVTADHETGGLTLGSSPYDAHRFYEIMSGQRGSYLSFEGKVAPKSAGEFGEYLRRAGDFFGFDASELSSAERDDLRKAFALSATPASKRAKGGDYNRLYATYDPFTVAALAVANGRAGVTWTTHYHTDKSVPVSAVGAGSEAFARDMDNTEIFAELKKAMGL